LNGRERVLAALDHQAVDRLPLGFFAVDYNTVEHVLGHETFLRAKAKSQIALWEGRRDEVAQSWREDAIEFYGKMDMIDIVPVGAMASSVLPPKDYEPEKPEKIDDVTWKDKRGRVYRFSEQTGDITCIADPELSEKIFRAEDFRIPDRIDKPDDSCFEVVDAVIEAFQGDRFLNGPAGNEAAMVMLGDNYERGLLEFALNPEVVRAAQKQALKLGELEDQYYIRPGQDGVLWGADFSSNSGPMISPEMFKEFCLPNIRERVKQVRARGIRVLKHACGNNHQLMDYFIEAGYEAYQSIQVSAGMDLENLYQNYGDRLAIWGGVMVEHLIDGTPADVRDDVENAFRIAATGQGGFILGTSHSVAVGTRYENFMTMIETALTFNERWKE
jgi:uroporphyrinogen decarboxylase